MNHEFIMSEFGANVPERGRRAHAMASLLKAGVEAGQWWREEDLPDILNHQWTAPLPDEFKMISSGAGSFGEALMNPCPSLETLELIKEFAKAHRNNPGYGLPPQVAGDYYFLAIAVALVRLGRRITRLADRDLKQGWQGILAHAWVDGSVRQLVIRALEKLSGETSPR